MEGSNVGVCSCSFLEGGGGMDGVELHKLNSKQAMTIFPFPQLPDS